MDYSYSPHRPGGGGGGMLHLPSPTHASGYQIDSFPSIKQIRRSLSRSPSKASRFQIHQPHAQTPSGSPKSPLSPLAFARAFSPKASRESLFAPDFTVSTPPAPSSAAKKSKFTLRKSTPFRSSPRTFRRALSDSLNQGNATPSPSRRSSSGDENGDFRKPNHIEKYETEPKSYMARRDLNDGPVKFEISRTRNENLAPGARIAPPMKSSPLKRSDGIMNLDQASLSSPVAKRRSLHGVSYGADFDIFDPATTNLSDRHSSDSDREHAPSFPSPVAKRSSSPRKSISLRKSTLQQRHGTSNVKSKPSFENEFLIPGPAASKSRARMSLDSSLAFANPPAGPQLRRMSPFEPLQNQSNQNQFNPPRATSNVHHPPHPLSNALTPSSSTSSMDDSPTHAPALPPTTASRNTTNFSRSLPIGAMRPSAPSESQQTSDSGTFSTPDAYKMAKPHPAAFMSTGLISKRNRNIDDPPAGSFAGYAMPDTPSKRVSFPPMNSSPLHRSTFSKSSRPLPEFGTPSSPFSSHSNTSPKSFGESISIFGALKGGNDQRRSSFVSIDGDDASQSPSGQMESQSSNDEFPPTPTKQTNGGRASKENSLRSSLFGRRTSLGPDTFMPPVKADVSPLDKKASPISASDSFDRVSPHTPQESFAPPDPSSLSISINNRRGSSLFGNSHGSNQSSFPPATPTASREQTFYFGNSHGSAGPIAGLTQNDVDTTLTSRFSTVTMYGNGEFSQVYRVEKPFHSTPCHSPATSAGGAVGKVWAVKKTKKPYIGAKDRNRKMREVRILSALRGHEHVIHFTDSWESSGHLYIQTEFCEDGNLKDFLAQAGFKGRLDDFRIWKILLELSLGVKHIHDSGFIHLDLKPANIFIDYEGVLKIGDFGLASTWPAPSNIEGEGDREYIGPEVLSGKFDKPADIFALGMIMLEIAGNIILPDNGTSWRRLRSGDMSDLPSLTWSSESTLTRNESGDPINELAALASHDTLCASDTEDDNLLHNFSRSNQQQRSNGLSFHDITTVAAHRPNELLDPPSFMVDPDDPQTLDRIVQWMIAPDPHDRPVVEQVYLAGGVQWVEKRRRAGATIYEGNWGPADAVLLLDNDHDQQHHHQNHHHQPDGVAIEEDGNGSIGGNHGGAGGGDVDMLDV